MGPSRTPRGPPTQREVGWSKGAYREVGCTKGAMRGRVYQGGSRKPREAKILKIPNQARTTLQPEGLRRGGSLRRKFYRSKIQLKVIGRAERGNPTSTNLEMTKIDFLV